MEAAAYLRVSSRSQDEATQRSAIERAAAARGDVVVDWFAERVSSRKERPKLKALLDQARRGELAPVLYVFRLDRLSRNGIRDTLRTVEELRAAGVRLRTLADGFDTDGPVADVVIAVMAWAAQMERDAIGERISAARARVEAKGGAWGRPRRATPEQVAAVRRLRDEGRTQRSIAMATKLPRATVRAILGGKGPYAAKTKAA